MNAKRLREHVRRRLSLRITVRDPEDEIVYGFPVAASGALLLVQAVADFDPDGWVAVPWGNVAGFRSGRIERFAERVLMGEGVTRRRCPAWLETSSLATLLASLMKRQRNVVIQTAAMAAKAAPGENCFHLGRIVSVDSTHVRMRTVDAVGKWDRRATRVRIEQICLIQFDNRYIRTFSKYAPDPEDRTKRGAE